MKTEFLDILNEFQVSSCKALSFKNVCRSDILSPLCLKLFFGFIFAEIHAAAALFR